MRRHVWTPDTFMMSFYDELHFPMQPKAPRLQQQLHSRQKRLGARHDLTVIAHCYWTKKLVDIQNLTFFTFTVIVDVMTHFRCQD